MSFSLFSCETCGDLKTCHHKISISQHIRFVPNQLRIRHELRSISKQEREQVWADIFGTSTTTSTTAGGSNGIAADSTTSTTTTYEVNPDEETIQRSLQQLKELLLSEVPPGTGEGPSSKNSKLAGSFSGAGTTTTSIIPAHQIVLRENPDYIFGGGATRTTADTCENSSNNNNEGDDNTQDDFLLRFLYADKFNVPLAYQRMKDYFDIKLVLFGSHLLCCDISTIDNFINHASKVLHEGDNSSSDRHDDDGIIDLQELTAIVEMFNQMEFVRFLSHVDYANRPIFFARASKINYQHPKRNVSNPTRCVCVCVCVCGCVTASDKKREIGLFSLQDPFFLAKTHDVSSYFTFFASS